VERELGSAASLPVADQLLPGLLSAGFYETPQSVSMAGNATVNATTIIIYNLVIL
jgi:hypothetical protein